MLGLSGFSLIIKGSTIPNLHGTSVNMNEVNVADIPTIGLFEMLFRTIGLFEMLFRGSSSPKEDLKFFLQKNKIT